MALTCFQNARVVLPHEIRDDVCVVVEEGKILSILPDRPGASSVETINLAGQYLMPGLVDLHVHGGAGHDFMDGTEEAFRAICRCHARHGTTTIMPTTTVARHDQHLAFLETCRKLKNQPLDGARIVGAHFYGPYFAAEAKGCHPADSLRPPMPEEYRQYLDYDCIVRATVAPELPGAEAFARECVRRGIGCNAGHSYATFDQVRASLEWGVTHVDHLFSAMSDRAKLRLTQNFPMRGGLMEATLYFDELTTEVIADGKHLAPELLLLAYKIKGPDKLALVTDSNRAVDMPDGPYLFGPLDGGVPILRKDDVGVMPDGKALASGVVGMDDSLRTFYQATKVPLVDVVRMATLTPARIAGLDREIGSIEVGKRADFVVMDNNLRTSRVYLAGKPFTS